MRPIDADVLMERLTRKKADVANQRYTEGFNDAILKFRSMLHSEPNLDCEPVRHGKWVHAEPNGFEGQKPFVCSECGLRHPRFGNTNQVYFRFCPWCGAKMDGGTEE